MKNLMRWIVPVLLASVAGAAGEISFDQEVSTDIQNQFTQDLKFVGEIKGTEASPLHKDVFGLVSGDDYLKFFNKRIATVGFEDHPTFIAFVDGDKAHKMSLTNKFVEFSHPQIARIMTMFHEARHAENDSEGGLDDVFGVGVTWTHEDCPDPFVDENGDDRVSIFSGIKIAGLPGCDNTPIGGYGSSAIMLKNVQKFCTSCTEKVKTDAGIYSDDQALRITEPKSAKTLQNDLNSK